MNDEIRAVNLMVYFAPCKFKYNLGYKIGAFITAKVGTKILKVESSVMF